MLSGVAADSVPGNAVVTMRSGSTGKRLPLCHYALGLFDRIFIYTSKRRSIVDESFFVGRPSIQILQFFRRSPFEQQLRDFSLVSVSGSVKRCRYQ